LSKKEGLGKGSREKKKRAKIRVRHKQEGLGSQRRSPQEKAGRVQRPHLKKSKERKVKRKKIKEKPLGGIGGGKQRKKKGNRS